MMISRLRVNSAVSDADADALKTIPSVVKDLPREAVLVREGDRPTNCIVMMRGFSYRSKVNEHGKRQILSFHPAGDMPDLHGLLLDRMDHDLTTLSSATVAFIEHRHINRLIEDRPQLARALWRETVVDASIFREWIVNLGTREAAARLAHLLAELRTRLAAVGLTADDEFAFPITQNELAEALGISSVHVNRVIQSFRAEGLIELTRDTVRLKDLEKLLELGGFNEFYLHQKNRNG
jgi:CRP-like cAMP-binding protein